MASTQTAGNKVPVHALLVDINGDPIVGTGGGPATVADGADVNAGTTTDAKVTGDSAGTLSAKLRGLSFLLNDVISTASHWLSVHIADAALPPLAAGSSLIGKVGIDQTTPGTTNLVAVTTQAIKQKFGTANQPITCAITSLANNGQRQSTAVDNTSNLFQDALVSLIIKSAAAATSATGYVNVYAYGTVNGGTNYSDGATGSDAAITLTSPPNMRLIGVINVVANSTTYNGGPMSVAAAFGGVLPASWGIVVENKTGATLDAAVGSAFYQGVQGQAV